MIFRWVIPSTPVPATCYALDTGINISGAKICKLSTDYVSIP